MKKALTCISIIVVILIILGSSLFSGFVVFAGGLGSFFPSLNQIAKPIVCGSDVMQVEQHVYSYKPGSTSYTITVYCINDTTGAQKDVTNQTQLVTGLIYSAILFVPFLFVAFLVVFLIVQSINKIRQQQATGNY